jgi:hypothetical protein
MDTNGRPDHIEDVLVTLHSGQWFGWSDARNKVYANLVIHSADAKPTENSLTTELATMQTTCDDAATAKTTNTASAKTKLKALGLTDGELKDALGIE